MSEKDKRKAEEYYCESLTYKGGCKSCKLKKCRYAYLHDNIKQDKKEITKINKKDYVDWRKELNEINGELDRLSEIEYNLRNSTSITWDIEKGTIYRDGLKIKRTHAAYSKYFNYLRW